MEYRYVFEGRKKDRRFAMPVKKLGEGETLPKSVDGQRKGMALGVAPPAQPVPVGGDPYALRPVASQVAPTVTAQYVCSQCGSATEEGAQFCGVCGGPAMKAEVTSTTTGPAVAPQVSVNVTFQVPTPPVAPAAPPPTSPQGGGETKRLQQQEFLPAAKGPARPKRTIVEVMGELWSPAEGTIETAIERFERRFFKVVVVILVLALVVGIGYSVYRLAGVGSAGSVPASDAGVDV